MNILSHRGYWKEPIEKNLEVAFRRSFRLGFGTETDVRDYNGDLVISHDIPDGTELSFANFLELYCQYDKNLPLAINIKSDGLQNKIKELLEANGISQYFVFDMSVPDSIHYINHGIVTFTRQSEIESIPSLYESSQGVWLDSFYDKWFDEELIRTHLETGKKVCIVSPELHKREYFEFWNWLKNSNLTNSNYLLLCTDHPEEARTFFEEE